MIHCPACGTELQEQNGELWCPKGQMGLSAHAAELLQAVAANPPTDHQLPTSYGNRWHCPVDGTGLHMDGNVLRCPTCRRSLSKELLYNLVEFFPHP